MERTETHQGTEVVRERASEAAIDSMTHAYTKGGRRAGAAEHDNGVIPQRNFRAELGVIKHRGIW